MAPKARPQFRITKGAAVLFGKSKAYPSRLGPDSGRLQFTRCREQLLFKPKL